MDLRSPYVRPLIRTVICKNSIETRCSRIHDSADPQLTNLWLYPIERGDAVHTPAIVSRCLAVSLLAITCRYLCAVQQPLLKRSLAVDISVITKADDNAVLIAESIGSGKR